ncbi:hypothetical protein HYW59_04315 [Candidatus Kaiserbacteria bacterium]|nr:hypothetical protein [Candidatus Kaiserbacteria bacterium]
MEASEKTTAVVISCSDPRLADAADAINAQFKKELGVERIIPLHRPGVVGLFSDSSAVHRPSSLDSLASANTTMEDVRRFALEEEIAMHLLFHRPDVLAIVAHHDCLGHPGNDEHQERSAIIAASVLRRRMGRYCFSGRIRSATLEECPNPGWRVKMLD